jgi:hypothetical protein
MWTIPNLSLLIGTDKDALQTIFVSLQKEIEKLNKEISELKKIKEVTAY